MTYEYDLELLPLSDEQQKVLELGLAKMEEINTIIKTVINQRAKLGWEPLYPFSVPMLWFKREVKKSRKK
jgi:hypothetical protein